MYDEFVLKERVHDKNIKSYIIVFSSEIHMSVFVGVYALSFAISTFY